jgi:hypothetical protein
MYYTRSFVAKKAIIAHPIKKVKSSFYPERLRTGPKGGPGGSFIAECSVSNALTMSNPVKRGKLLHQGRASLSKRPVPFFLLLRTLLTFVCMLLAPSPPLLLGHTFLPHSFQPRDQRGSTYNVVGLVFIIITMSFSQRQGKKKKPRGSGCEAPHY